MLNGCLGFLRWGCMRYLVSPVSVLPALDGRQHVFNLEMQQQCWCMKLSNDLL